MKKWTIGFYFLFSKQTSKNVIKMIEHVYSKTLKYCLLVKHNLRNHKQVVFNLIREIVLFYSADAHDCIITPDLASPEETRFVDIVSMGVRKGKGQGGGALATPAPQAPPPWIFKNIRILEIFTFLKQFFGGEIFTFSFLFYVIKSC